MRQDLDALTFAKNKGIPVGMLSIFAKARSQEICADRRRESPILGLSNLGRWAVLLSMIAGAAVGCSSTGGPSLDDERMADGVSVLSRPLPGDLAALYRMRVPKTGGLRLAVVTAGGEGRMTISEPFGSAVSLTAWSGDGSSVHFDMEQGCRRDVADLRQVLGLRALPLAQAVRLLGGRLPVGPGDDVTLVEGSGIEVRGDGWGARVRLAVDPWRVLEVAEIGARDDDGWLIELADHTSSVPGRIRVTNADGRWAELDLSRMEWPEGAVLPHLPNFPHCGG